jgi:hypothetical protein
LEEIPTTEQWLHIEALKKQASGDPRGTPENRPMRDTSKPANGAEAGQALLYPAGAFSGKPFLL